MLHNLTISDLRLALDELFERRLDILRATGVGRSYEPQLARYREQLVKLAVPTGTGRPPADLLAQAHRTYKGWGTALFHVMEAYSRLPTFTEEERYAISSLRQVFMPRLGEMREGYAMAAARAFSRGRQLQAHTARLSSFPVLGDQTLADWVGAYVVAGRKLGELMAFRADANANAMVGSSERVDAGPLRSSVVGLLGRLRVALADELAGRPELHRKLDAELFAYIDELTRMRVASHRGRGTVEADEPPQGPADTGRTFPGAA